MFQGRYACCEKIQISTLFPLIARGEISSAFAVLGASRVVVVVPVVLACAHFYTNILCSRFLFLCNLRSTIKNTRLILDLATLASSQ